jgi:hypothetical protein
VAHSEIQPGCFRAGTASRQRQGWAEKLNALSALKGDSFTLETGWLYQSILS